MNIPGETSITFLISGGINPGNIELLNVGEGLWETASAVPTIFKIQDSRIHDIEAMGFTMPCMSGNGLSYFLR